MDSEEPPSKTPKPKKPFLRKGEGVDRRINAWKLRGKVKPKPSSARSGVPPPPRILGADKHNVVPTAAPAEIFPKGGVNQGSPFSVQGKKPAQHANLSNLRRQTPRKLQQKKLPGGSPAMSPPPQRTGNEPEPSPCRSGQEEELSCDSTLVDLQAAARQEGGGGWQQVVLRNNGVGLEGIYREDGGGHRWNERLDQMAEAIKSYGFDDDYQEPAAASPVPAARGLRSREVAGVKETEEALELEEFEALERRVRRELGEMSVDYGRPAQGSEDGCDRNEGRRASPAPGNGGRAAGCRQEDAGAAPWHPAIHPGHPGWVRPSESVPGSPWDSPSHEHPSESGNGGRRVASWAGAPHYSFDDMETWDDNDGADAAVWRGTVEKPQGGDQEPPVPGQSQANVGHPVRQPDALQSAAQPSALMRSLFHKSRAKEEQAEREARARAEKRESERIAALEAEIGKFQAERAEINRAKNDLQVAAARLESERASFDRQKAAELASIQEEREEMSRMLKREKNVLEKQRKALLKMPTKKERSEIESLEALLEKEKKEGRAREARHKLTVERLRTQMVELQQRNAELRDEVRWHEQQRLKEQTAKPVGRSLTPEARVLKNSAERVSKENEDPNACLEEPRAPHGNERIGTVNVASRREDRLPPAPETGVDRLPQSPGSCTETDSEPERSVAAPADSSADPATGSAPWQGWSGYWEDAYQQYELREPQRWQAPTEARNSSAGDGHHLWRHGHLQDREPLSIANGNAPHWGPEQLGTSRGHAEGSGRPSAEPLRDGAPRSVWDLYRSAASQGPAACSPGQSLDLHAFQPLDLQGAPPRREPGVAQPPAACPSDPGQCGPGRGEGRQGASRPLDGQSQDGAWPEAQMASSEVRGGRRVGGSAAFEPNVVALPVEANGGFPPGAGGGQPWAGNRVGASEGSRFSLNVRHVEAWPAAPGPPPGVGGAPGGSGCDWQRSAEPNREGCGVPNPLGPKPDRGAAVERHAAVSGLRHPSDPVIQQTQHADGKLEQVYGSGKRTVLFANGTYKEQLPDGTAVICFTNQDIKRTFPTGKVEYYYAEVDTWQTTLPTGINVFYFPEGQREAHEPNGVKQIMFPDGNLRRVLPNG
mmetsp:Transcript_26689/g.63249  ORF Transcript_26689/g.63249 Transcript_26689/m.63249 type:complete len:1111 (-) Transcript_26689:1334-4666(-)